MRPSVGQVVGFWTEDVLRPSNDGGSYKYHLCVDADVGLHLFVCSSGYANDFELPQSRCLGLSAPMSYVSLSRVIKRTTIPKKHRMACTVSDDFLRDLLDHLEDARSMSPNDKLAVSIGIAKHLNAKAAD